MYLAKDFIRQQSIEMMFHMTQRIKFPIAVLIIRRQLETIQILKIVNGLVAIEMLQVRYFHLICIEKSSNNKTITEFAAILKFILSNTENFHLS